MLSQPMHHTQVGYYNFLKISLFSYATVQHISPCTVTCSMKMVSDIYEFELSHKESTAKT